MSDTDRQVDTAPADEAAPAPAAPADEPTKAPEAGEPGLQKVNLRDMPPSQKDEIGGPRGPEPTRYGDWERKGRVSDF